VKQSPRWAAAQAEPPPRLEEAIAALGNAVRRAATADGVPTVSGLVAEVEQDFAGCNGVAALSRRVLQSRIASRIAGTVRE
jgi:hypothetical protein